MYCATSPTEIVFACDRGETFAAIFAVYVCLDGNPVPGSNTQRVAIRRQCELQTMYMRRERSPVDKFRFDGNARIVEDFLVWSLHTHWTAMNERVHCTPTHARPGQRG